MTTASTKAQATRTRKNAQATARSAASTVRNARSTAASRSKATTNQLNKETKRVTGAAKAEVEAVASQPTRPLYFALGVANRTVVAVKDLPSALSPARARQRVVARVKSVGDLAERAQQGYTEVAKDGEKLVAKVRRQESTQQAVKYAERAQANVERAGKNASKSADAAVEAVKDAAENVVGK